MRNDELMHYGVLGMKWGHRKQRPRRSDEERAARRRKIAKGLGAAAGVAGASAGAYYLYKHGKRNKKSINIKKSKYNPIYTRKHSDFYPYRTEPKVSKSVFRNSKGKKVYPKRTQRPKTYYYKNGKPVRKPLKIYADEFGNMSPKIKTGKDYLNRHHGAVKGPKVGSGNNMKASPDDVFRMRFNKGMKNEFYDKMGIPMHPMWNNSNVAQNKYLRKQGVKTVYDKNFDMWRFEEPYKKSTIPNVKTHRRK